MPKKKPVDQAIDFKYALFEIRDMALLITSLATLPWDQKRAAPVCNSSSRRSRAFFWPPHVIHAYMQVKYTYT